MLAAFPKCYLDALVVHKTMMLETWIRQAREELDIDGLEFYWGFTPYTDRAELSRIRSLVESLGLCIPMMCYSSDFTKPTASERAAEVEKQKTAIEVTAALGGKFCRVLSGQRRPNLGRADGVRMAADCINSLIPYAERSGVTLILENHYKDGYWEQPEFAQKMDVFLELLNAIPVSPGFGVNYDPSNAIIAGDDPLLLLEAVKSRVVTMHASDRYFKDGTAADLRKMEAHPQTGYASILRHGVIGEGLNDYDRIFSTLSGVGFKGWVSIEDGDDPACGMEHLKKSALFLRRKMKDHGLK